MTNQKYRIVFTIAVVGLLCVGMWYLESSKAPVSNMSGTRTKSTVTTPNSFKSVYRPSSEDTQTGQNNSRKPASQIPSPVWKTKLEKSLLAQANGRLKSSEITKVDSFSWKVGKVEVPVESLLIKLVEVNGQVSTFRAMVDSTNGKILQTWDHPHSENFDDKNHDGIRIDSRYHND